VWYNTTDDQWYDTIPVVTNDTITAAVRLPGVAVLGFRFRRPGKVLTFLMYAFVNILATSVVLLPIATSLVPVACILFGFLGGMLVNVSTTCVGAYLGLVLARYACRPCFVRALGKHHGKWMAIDRAVATDGWQISLLIRCSPLSPLVITNILLALTSISQFSFVWTVFVGEIVTSFPYAYATHIGVTLVDRDKGHQDPTMIAASFLSLAATVAIAYKVSRLAMSVLEQRDLYERVVPDDA